ncbi:methyl-accepting chemotaxis protein [Duganella sp. BJB1802]|uniref:methyl-accepting chemotaxis protein n=1 Tax=Duganella sp. BJB1802 TaxID=2744575 RepID=UPI0026575E6B|nr:methyl-accepting chemotaxis protein [Duganella sp. BJB1802]
MNLANFKIGHRMAAGFACILALLLLIALLGVNGMSDVQARLEEITFTNNPESALVIEMASTIDDQTIALRNIVLYTEMDDMLPEMERIKADQKRYNDAEEKLRKMFAGSPSTLPEENAQFDKARQLKEKSLPLIAEAAALGLANKNEEATKVLLVKFRPLQHEWRGTLTQFAAFEQKMNEQAAQDARKNFKTARTLVLAASALALVLGGAISWFIARGITRPIQRALEVAQTVAAGDLGSHIDVTGKDETGQLLLALKEMNDGLVSIVSEVRAGTETIASASSQIATGNQDLSSRTEEQASSLEETASSMEELTSTVKQNADNARQANQLAITASEVAVKGGTVVSEVVSNMEEINGSARRIVDIIGVIDSIAFQTNILALNAAVEAARAGEQGRGFAVVATEVRNLAQRSAQAAKEIKGLIDHSVTKVELGSRLVEQAGVTMREVVGSIRQVTDLMGEISAASAEQTVGIGQVQEAVMQMDQATQQNAALVEEAAAASEAMQVQADNLAQVVGRFKLKSQPSMARTAARPPKPARALIQGRGATPGVHARRAS